MSEVKHGLMTQFPYARGRKFVCKNIGDYVQSIASMQYAGRDAELIEQEEADSYQPLDGHKAKLIMNGWFQWRAENWPPSDHIIPLLVSMHISPLRKDQLLTEKGIEFLKNNGPVGCRDYYTEDLLKSKGIPAYFSACMTLTLGKTYSVKDENRSGVYFVDPYFDVPDQASGLSPEEKEKLFDYFHEHSDCILRLANNPFFKDYSPTGFLDRDETWGRNIYKAALFHRLYSKKFSENILSEATYITHWIDVDMSGKVTNRDLLNYAERLIKKYASARLVVTSRIHAALPALACGTPVIFIANEQVTSENGNFNTPGRLDGLLQFFRILTLSGSEFSTEDDVLKSADMIDDSFTFRNKESWKKYAAQLDLECTRFMTD